MTPQEKVIELRQKFIYILLQSGSTETYESTKQCVDVVLNEILNVIDAECWEFTYGFYQQAKEENK